MILQKRLHCLATVVSLTKRSVADNPFLFFPAACRLTDRLPMRDRFWSVSRIAERGHRSWRVVIVCCMSLLAAGVAAPVCAQVGMIAGAEGDGNENQNQLPFLLPVQPTDIAEAMEDFKRFAGRKQWEKAFKHLEK